MLQNIREKFIVTADDYGIRETTAPILKLAREGRIDRVGVLIHFVSKEEAQGLQETGVKIDLHLELIELLRSGKKVRESALLRGVNFAWRYSLGRATAKQAEVQWRQQIERFRELFGRLPDGLNSHEHVHYFPVFFKSFLHLADECGIGFVRFGKRGILKDSRGIFVWKVLDFFWKRDSRVFSETTLHSSDFVTSLDWVAEPKTFFGTLPEGTIELVVHPEREEEHQTIREYF